MQSEANLPRANGLLSQERELLESSKSGVSDPLQFLFVLGVGRSGTTILQHVLNTIPGFCIRGENGGAIWPLVETYGRVKKNRTGDGKWARSWSGDPWFGFNEVSLDGLASSLRETFVSQILNPPPSTRCTGFKEIRFPIVNLAEKVDLVRELFPRARFILNFRSLESTTKSGWWPNSGQSRRVVSRQLRQLSKLGKSLGDTSYSVTYETFYSLEDERADLFRWLGAAYDRQAVDQAIKTPLNHLRPSHKHSQG